MTNTLRNSYYRIFFYSYYATLADLKFALKKEMNPSTLKTLSDFYSSLIAFPFKYYSHHEEITESWGISDRLASIPSGLIRDIYLRKKDFFDRFENILKTPDKTALSNLLDDANLFLDEVTTALEGRKVSINRYVKYVTAILLTAALIYTLPSLQRYTKRKVDIAREVYRSIEAKNAIKAKKIEGILILKEALQKYHDDHDSYPKSSPGWDGILSDFGESKADWIPGLVPEYLSELPVDPRKSSDPRKQYLYQSDGKNYKLISHDPENMDFIVDQFPDMIDPVRKSWAFGVWSEDAKNW